MSARFSHAACAHPSTKVARAACRRSMKKFAAALAEIIETPAPTITSPIITAWDSMINGPRELTAAPAKIITRENWRDVKGQTAVIVTPVGAVAGKITGWGPNLLQYKNDETGKLVRIPVDEVASVTA